MCSKKCFHDKLRLSFSPKQSVPAAKTNKFGSTGAPALTSSYFIEAKIPIKSVFCNIEIAIISIIDNYHLLRIRLFRNTPA